nr:hypothetical protein [Bacillaceae bacterium]
MPSRKVFCGDSEESLAERRVSRRRDALLIFLLLPLGEKDKILMKPKKFYWYQREVLRCGNGS